MSESAKTALLKSLESLQKSEQYSDLTVICGDATFKVHKAIICPRSEYFATSCRWKEDTKLEDGSKPEIVLEDESRLIGLLLDYMYQLDYDDSSPAQNPNLETGQQNVAPASPETQHISHEEPNGTDLELEDGTMLRFDHTKDIYQVVNATAEDECLDVDASEEEMECKQVQFPPSQDENDVALSRLSTNALMYALADKYMISDLKFLAKVKFNTAAETDWQSKDFLHAAKLVFTTTVDTDKGLRKSVIKVLNEHRTLAETEEVRNLLDSGNGMASMLVEALLKPVPRSEEAHDYGHFGFATEWSYGKKKVKGRHEKRFNFE